MIEINLIPDVKQELIRARRIRSAVVSGAIITTIVAVGIVVALAVYVYAVQAVRDNLANDAIKTGSAKLASVEDLSKMLTIQNQLTKMSALNDDKTINSRVFDLLLAVIPPAPNTVQVSKLVVNTTDETMTLEGQTPTYSSLETFKKTLDAAHIRYNDSDSKQQEIALASSLSLSNISFGENETGAKVLRFTITFNYAKELLSPATTNPVIVFINGGNVTDSYVGIPKSIFTNRAADVEESK